MNISVEENRDIPSTVSTDAENVVVPAVPAEVFTDVSAEVEESFCDVNFDSSVQVNTSLIHWRSTREKRQPSYLKDFHCGMLNTNTCPPTSTKFPLQKCISYDRLSTKYKNFILNVSFVYEPQFYHQAVLYEHWREAMASELAVVETNRTWFVVPLPKGKHSIGCK